MQIYYGSSFKEDNFPVSYIDYQELINDVVKNGIPLDHIYAFKWVNQPSLGIEDKSLQGFFIDTTNKLREKVSQDLHKEST